MIDFDEFLERHDLQIGEGVPEPAVASELEAIDMPWHFANMDIFENYSDDDIYWLDVKVREMLHSAAWRRMTKKGALRTCASTVFECIFGRPMTSEDNGLAKKLHRILDYYAAKTTGQNWIGGKCVRHVYYFNQYTGQHKRPYSVRLALEEADGDDEKVFKYFDHSDENVHTKRTDGRNYRGARELSI